LCYVNGQPQWKDFYIHRHKFESKRTPFVTFPTVEQAQAFLEHNPSIENTPDFNAWIVDMDEEFGPPPT
jgi:viroplasmin and RNaseH domain-containing protein